MCMYLMNRHGMYMSCLISLCIMCLVVFKVTLQSMFAGADTEVESSSISRPSILLWKPESSISDHDCEQIIRNEIILCLSYFE